MNVHPPQATRLLLPLLALLLAVLAFGREAAAAPAGLGGLSATTATSVGLTRPDTVALCFVARARPDRERTIHTTPMVADLLVRFTLSYHGPCARYGQSAPRGNGSFTAYSQAEGGVPTAIGVVFPKSTLTGLPTDPPTDGLWCYDKNADGTTDQMTECSGGYESALQLSDSFTVHVQTPFTFLLVNWNPFGHGPPGVYNVPHFDLHFYMTSNAERLAIRTGHCGELVNCDDYRLGKILPAPKYRPAAFKDTDALAPAMGNHLIDTTGPEFHGQPFTHSFIYGVWNGTNTFFEPMVTKAWFDGLVHGSRASQCFPYELPAAYQRTGWFPTRYCLRYRDNRHELTASLEGFVHRQAS